MHYLKAAGGGLVGGLIGAAVWAAIVYFAHVQIGWVAWGVGFLVGLGVRLVAQERDGSTYGIIAVGIAVLSIVAGKYMAVSLLVADSGLDDLKIQVTDEYMIGETADTVAAEWKAKGKKVDAPPQVNPNTGLPGRPLGDKYTPAVMAEAKKRWNAMPAADRQAKVAQEQKEADKLLAGVGDTVRQKGFEKSFSPFDLLWFGLAAFTAFKLGSGMATGD